MRGQCLHSVLVDEGSNQVFGVYAATRYTGLGATALNDAPYRCLWPQELTGFGIAPVLPCKQVRRITHQTVGKQSPRYKLGKAGPTGRRLSRQGF